MTTRPTMLWTGLVVGSIVVGVGCGSGDVSAPPEAPPAFLVERLGGDTAARELRGRPFHQSARSLTNEEFARFGDGAVVFDAHFEESDGLGPLYNEDSCLSCHLDGDTEVDAPEGEPGPGLLLRLSVPGDTSTGGPLGDPVYGTQLQDDATGETAPEGRIVTRWEVEEGTYPDGAPYELRRPSFDVVDLAAGPLAPDVMVSPRVAPPLIGMGLLESIPESFLVALADEGDEDGDGVSGRLNTVWDRLADRPAVGRFGWKAGQPSVRQQSVVALNHDMGMTSDDIPDPCDGQGSYCAEVADPESDASGPDVDATAMADQIFYNRTIAVPIARRTDDPSVIRGARMFEEIGCSSCHIPTVVTGRDVVEGLSDQTIHPFTDLLLHDMGEGLDDRRPEFDAEGAEWRTPPLWGLSRRAEVTGFANYLHDGRARSYEEAVLWHGGEGRSARDRFMESPESSRRDLLEYLGSL